MINYYLITKPGIVFGNLVTVSAGFLLASRGSVDFKLFFATLFGLCFIMASACVFNNYIDRRVDEKMERTKNRALVKGMISARNAITFGVALGIIGSFFLLKFTNTLTFAVAGVGFFVYVLLYSLWKCRTIYGTAIGSVAGAVPPIVGYCAVRNDFDSGAIILFAMMVLWQMPHFFSIAILHLKDYTAADVQVLPVKKGMQRTKIHMALYIIAFIIASAMLTFSGYTGYTYLIVATSFGLFWLILSVKGFAISQKDDLDWGRRMFRFSLLTIFAICSLIPFDFV